MGYRFESQARGILIEGSNVAPSARTFIFNYPKPGLLPTGYTYCVINVLNNTTVDFIFLLPNNK